MNVIGGTADVTTYFVLRLAATGVEATGLTITNFDLQYVRTGVAPVAKVDATALAATDSAHADNKAIEIDATNQPGLYRVDWPDLAFAAGVRQVILTVKCATVFTEHMAVEIDTPVDVAKISTDATAADNCELMFDGTGYAGGTAKLTVDIAKIGGQTATAASAVTVGAYVGNATAALGVDASGRVDMGSWLGTAVTTDAITSKPQVDAFSISGDATAANNAELAFDGTGFGFTNCTMPTTTALTNAVTLANGAHGGAGTVITLQTPIVANATQIKGADATDQINAACDAAIETYKLDHLVAVADADDVVNDSIIAKLASSAAVNADWSTFVSTTDSLQAVRDRGDAAWVTATGFALATVCTELRLAELDAANLPTDVANVKIDTAAILVDTGTTLDALIAAIKAQTDKLVFTVANQVDANIRNSKYLVEAQAAALCDTTHIISDTAGLDATNDHYNGRIIIFTSGACKDQATVITDYVGATTTFTVPALTDAPADNDTFVIL